MKGKIIIICLIILLIVLSSGCTQDQNDENSADDNGSSDETDQSRPNILLWSYSPECNKITDLKFSASPIDLNEVTNILPMGGLTGIVGGHYPIR